MLRIKRVTKSPSQRAPRVLLAKREGPVPIVVIRERSEVRERDEAVAAHRDDLAAHVMVTTKTNFPSMLASSPTSVQWGKTLPLRLAWPLSSFGSRISLP